MHHHCEIIMPGSKTIGEHIANVMNPFDENTQATNTAK